MTGRGIDQVLPYPGSPVLYEDYVRDARDYVQLAEAASGSIPRPVDFAHIWGDALNELDRARPDVRIINLETSITCNGEPWPDKGIHYRMNPRNASCITAAHIDCCCLANNHVLDWGRQGLMDSIGTLDAAGVSHAGAGSNAVQAAAPAVLGLANKGRVLVFAFGSMDSGIPAAWIAGKNRPGVNLLENLSEDTARRVAADVRRYKGPGDAIVVSIHWGGNWGYAIPGAQMDFAHRLIENGVNVVHGHSSHHVKAIEVYRDRLILYGCGDFITDYEGIGGRDEFRSDLALMYLVKLSVDGSLAEVRLVPMRSRRFSLKRASREDGKWLCNLLNDLGSPFGTETLLEEDNSMALRWPRSSPFQAAV